MLGSQQASQPIIDWTAHPMVRSKMRKEYRESWLYSVIAFPAAALLAFLIFSDGLQPLDAIFIAVLGLLLFWGAAQAVSAATYRATYIGMKIYPDGIALPWRSLEDARSSRENFLRFEAIREIQLVGKATNPVVIVVRAGDSKPSKFIIDSMWIPELGKFLDLVQSKVLVRAMTAEST